MPDPKPIAQAAPEAPLQFPAPNEAPEENPAAGQPSDEAPAEQAPDTAQEIDLSEVPTPPQGGQGDISPDGEYTSGLNFSGQVGMGPGSNGDRTDTFFQGDSGPLNYTALWAKLSLDWDLSNGIVRPRLGPALWGTYARGGQDSGTTDPSSNQREISEAWAVIAGLQLTIDFRRAWLEVLDNSPVIPFPHLSAMIGPGIGGGKAGLGSFNSHDMTASFAAAWSVDAALIAFHIKQVELALGAGVANSVVVSEYGNFPLLFPTGLITLQGAPERKQEVPEEEDVCTKELDGLNQKIDELLADIQASDQQLKELKEQVAKAEGDVQAVAHHIENRKADPLDVTGVRDYLRQERSEQILAEMGSPKGEEAKAQAMAQAKEEYPDGYNHWESAPPATTDIEANLGAKPQVAQDASKRPQDCDELKKIIEQLTTYKEARDQATSDVKVSLAERFGYLTNLAKSALPPRKELVKIQIKEKIIHKDREKLSLNDVHFAHDKPSEAELENRWQGAYSLMDKSKSFNNGKVAFNNHHVRNSLAKIFGGRNHLSRVLEDMKKNVEALNSDAYKGERRRIAAHTSMVGNDAYNQALSQRRAELLHKIAIEMGANPDRLAPPKGYGESQPKENEDESGIGREEKARREAANRRVEFEPIDEDLNKAAEDLIAEDGPPPVTP